MIWILNEYYYYHRQIAASRLLDRDSTVLREEPLGSLSRLLSTKEKLKSLVLVRGDGICALALRWGQKFVPLRTVERTDMVCDMEAFERRSEIVDPALLDDAETAAELLGFEEILAQIRELEGYVDALLPKQFPPLPEEVCQEAGPGDTYGIFSESTYWWLQKRTGILHILGSGSAKTFTVPAENGFLSERTLLKPLFMLFVDCFELRRLIIHEGITDYWGVDMTWVSDGGCLKEVRLPRSLRRLLRLNCYTEQLKIPEDLRKLTLFSLVNAMGGHWDPVSYGARKLILPAGITFADELPELEPVCFLEEIEIYGENPIEDLNSWYKAGMLNVNTDQMLDISYPKSWDRGSPGAYAGQVLEFIRSKKPDKVDWSAGHNMWRPLDWQDWNEEDYQAFREYFHPIGDR